MVLLLTACFMFHGNGGQSGNEGVLMPPTCKIVEQTDLGADEVAVGFEFAPAAMIEASEGVWSGRYEVGLPDDRTMTEGRLQLGFADALPTLVTSEQAGTRSCTTPSSTCIAFGDDLYEEFSEPSPECPSRYELLPNGVFVGGAGALDEALTLTVTATPDFVANTHALNVYAAVPVEDLHGTARPTWDTAAWQTTELQLRAALDETGTLYGSTSWFSTGGLTETTSGEGEREETSGGFSLARE